MSNRAAKEVELAPSLVSIKDVELAPGPKQPGYWRKHWATPDPFLGQAIAPYPLPRTRGLHEWAVYVSQDPARSVTARSLAPLASIAVTLVQFLVLLLYGFETMMPSCGSHADCNRGQFCAAPSTTLCIDCKWAINGTNPYGMSWSASVAETARIHCADDIPDDCDFVEKTRVTVAGILVALAFMLIFPKAIIVEMENTATGRLLLEHRVKTKVLGRTAPIVRTLAQGAISLREHALPPVLTLATASNLGAQASWTARGLSVAFVAFSSVLFFDRHILFLFVHPATFEDAAFKDAVKQSEDWASFSGISSGWLTRRAYGFFTMVYVALCLTSMKELQLAFIGHTDCDVVADVYIYLSLILVFFCILGSLAAWFVDKPDGRITAQKASRRAGQAVLEALFVAPVYVGTAVATFYLHYHTVQL